MTGLYVFGLLLVTGFVALIVKKVQWPGRAAREFVTTAASDDVVS
jgi:hypothetical protein